MASHSVVLELHGSEIPSPTGTVDVFNADLNALKASSQSTDKDTSKTLAIECLDREDGSANEKETISFQSGHTEILTGEIRVYRRRPPPLNSTCTTEAKEEEDTPPPASSDILCFLAVPNYMSTADFLNYTAPVHDSFLALRIVRDKMPNRYMVLIKCRDAQAAEIVFNEYNNKPFNSMEPETCHVVYVDTVVFAADGELAHFPPQDPTLCELPTCPVCLERLDSNVSGVFTLLCNHTFHCRCLAKWGDSTCPVCRYGNRPSPDDVPNECNVCKATQDLWMCLICGNMGCGRYVNAHAAQHFKTSHHPFAIEIQSQRVWDYVGDGYVHRLITNKTDGKLVELPAQDRSPSGPLRDASNEKMEMMAIEFGNLLTTQLESQRLYYQEQLNNTEQLLSKVMRESEENYQAMLSENHQLNKTSFELRSELETTSKDKKALEKKLKEITAKYQSTLRELVDEKAVTSSLLSNQEKLRAQLAESEKKRTDAEEQLRDVMFYLEAQEKVQNAANKEEIQEGQVVIQQSTPAPKHRSPRRR